MTTITHRHGGACRLYLSCLVPLLFSGCSEPQDPDPPGAQILAITDGVEESGHPAVGELLFDTTGDGKRDKACTATLVGAKTVLTAAHCVGYQNTLFGTDGIAHDAASTLRHPEWDSAFPQVSDIGVVILTKPSAVEPMPLYTAAPQAGTTVTLIGFGETSNGAGDNNVKRIATNTIDSVETAHFNVSGTGGGEGNGCYGDSGGPTLIDAGGVETVGGIMSYVAGTCGSTMIVTRIDAFLPWIREVSQGDIEVTDSEKPKVTITAPQSGDTVGTVVKVQAEVTDNVGVVEVRGLVDDEQQGSLTAPPFEFTLNLSGDEHWLRVVARDAAGNEGNAAVLVSVNGSIPPPADGGGTVTEGDGAAVTARPPVEEGCQVAPRPGTGGAALFPIFLLALLVMTRRRAPHHRVR